MPLPCHNDSLRFRSAQISGNPILFGGEDDDFIKLSVTSAVELQRFSNAAIFLLDRAVVSDHVQGELVLLGIKVNLFFLGSTFFNCKLTVETAVGAAPFVKANS